MNLSMFTSIERQSLDLLARQFAPSIVVCLLSAMAVTTNSLLMYTITKTKDLHNKSQYVILSHAFAETLYALFTIVHHFRRVIVTLLGWPDLINNLTCALITQGVTISSKVAILAILMLCVDRLLAVGAPLVYRGIGPVKYVTGFNLVCWGIVLLQVPIGFIGLDPNAVLPGCNFVLAFPLGYRTMESTSAVVLAFITLAAYGAAIGIVSYRYWYRRWSSASERSTWSRQIQLSAFRMMMAVGCIYLASWGLTQSIILCLTHYASAATNVIYSPYVAALSILNTGSHFFVYYGFSKTFRKAFKKAVNGGLSVAAATQAVICVFGLPSDPLNSL